PGAGVDPAVAQQLLREASDNAQKIVASSALHGSGVDLLLNIVPTNVIRAAADNDILAVMFFAMMFGIGVVLTKSPMAVKTKEVIEGVFEISMTLIHLVIRFAPYAVACLVFNLAAVFGWDLLAKLAGYVGVALLAMAIHFFIVYSVSVRVFGGMSPLRFFRGSQEAIVMAFSTASSN